MSAHSTGQPGSAGVSPAKSVKSIGSLNTDGLGTPIEPLPPPSRGADTKAGKGKEKNKDTAPLLLSDEREEVEVQVPVLTQVGYEDEDAREWRRGLLQKVGGAPEVEVAAKPEAGATLRDVLEKERRARGIAGRTRRAARAL